MYVPGLVDPIDWTFDFVEEHPFISATVAAALANPKTRGATARFMWQAGSLLVKETARYNIRVAGGLSRIAWSRIAPALARVAASQAAARTVATGATVARGVVFAGAVGAGAILGAAGGMAISKAIWGDAGYQKAKDFYTFQVSPEKYFSTLKAGFWDSWDVPGL